MIALMSLLFERAIGAELNPLPDKKIFIPSLEQRYQAELKDLIPTSSLSEEGFYARVADTDIAVLMLPYETKEEEGVYWLSFIYAVINAKNKTLIQSYFHKDIAESNAIYIADYSLDVVMFQGISNDVVFSVKIEMLGSSRPNPMASTYLYLYALQDKKISLLLGPFEVMDSSGENNQAGLGYEIQQTLKYIQSKKSEDYPTLTFQSTRTHTEFNPEESVDKTTIKKGKAVTLLYLDGRYRNIDLKQVENKVKGSGSHQMRFYKSLIKAQPITRDNVRIYNDIAFYLEQNDHNEEAIYILNEVVRKFNERVVAYLNLADAYWKRGNKQDAYVNYWQYADTMHKKNKQNKIPARVNERLNTHKEFFEAQFIGKWKNKQCGYVVDIERKNQVLLYTLQTDKRKLQGELHVDMDVRAIYIEFMGIEWSEDLGGSSPVEDSVPSKEIQNLPIGIQALFDKDQEEFVIQNFGNASYYYVKLKEGCEKYIYFRRE